MILATFRAGLYVYHMHSVQNYVFAEVINKKTLHNHVFSNDGSVRLGGARVGVREVVVPALAVGWCGCGAI